MFSDTSDLLELEGSFFWYMLNFYMINILFKKTSNTLRILGEYYTKCCIVFLSSFAAV